MLKEGPSLTEELLAERARERGRGKAVATERVVWVVSSQHWLRACLRAELIERGHDAVGYVMLAQVLAVPGRSDGALPGVIVLDLSGATLQRGELDAMAGLGIAVVVLGGAMEMNAPGVSEFEWAAVVRLPSTIGQVADVVDDVFGRSPGTRCGS
jgi:hypothetical protein